MNLLILSYNLSGSKVKILDYNPVYYLVHSTNILTSKCKYVSIINPKFFEDQLIQQMEKIKKNFEYILILNNEKNYILNVPEIEMSIKDIKHINGNRIKNSYDRISQKLTMDQFDTDLLLISNFDNFNSLYPQEIKDVIFPHFSKVIYEYPEKCSFKKINGIYKNQSSMGNILI